MNSDCPRNRGACSVPAEPLRTFVAGKGTIVASGSTDNISSDMQQRFHDLCMVCAPQRAQQQDMGYCSSGQLGNRTLRVLASSSGQSHRIYRLIRRTIKDNSGSDNLERLHSIFSLLFGRAFGTRLPVGRSLSFGSGLFHLPR